MSSSSSTHHLLCPLPLHTDRYVLLIYAPFVISSSSARHSCCPPPIHTFHYFFLLYTPFVIFSSYTQFIYFLLLLYTPFVMSFLVYAPFVISFSSSTHHLNHSLCPPPEHIFRYFLFLYTPFMMSSSIRSSCPLPRHTIWRVFHTYLQPVMSPLRRRVSPLCHIPYPQSSISSTPTRSLKYLPLQPAA